MHIHTYIHTYTHTHTYIHTHIYIYNSQELNTTIRVQILDETDCISHSTNTLGKGMNPIIPPPAMGKQQDRLGSSALVRQLVQEKENSEFKPVKLRLKIDLVSYPARVEGLVNMIYIYIYIHTHINPVGWSCRSH